MELLLLLLLSLVFIGCNSQSSTNSNSDDDCACYSYSGAPENFDLDGTCKHCQTCSNNACKCPSKEDCQTIGVIVGVVFAVVFILCYVGCGIFFLQSRKRKRRRMIDNQRAKAVPPIPLTYVQTTTVPTVTYNGAQPIGLMQAIQQPQVIYVQQPVQQQLYVQQQGHAYAPMEIEAPPGYMPYNNVTPPTAPDGDADFGVIPSGGFADDPFEEYKQTVVNTHEEYIGNAENDSIEGAAKIVNEIEIDEAGANDVRMWLDSIGFGSYYDIFVQNTFDSLEMIKEIENENVLDSIGITSQEHQVKIMKNIKQITSFH